MGKNHVIHRDVKPSNVLISVDGQVKLADFGTAFDTSQLTHTVQQTLCGTPAFIAPEVVRKDKHTTSTDIWSLGVIVYSMVTGDIPFVADDKYALLLRISRGPMKVNFPDDVPLVVRQFIEACLAFDPRRRPKATDLLMHSLISDPSSGTESTIKTTSTGDYSSNTVSILNTELTSGNWSEVAVPRMVILEDEPTLSPSITLEDQTITDGTFLTVMDSVTHA